MLHSRRLRLLSLAILILAIAGYSVWRWPTATLSGRPAASASIIVSGNIEAHQSVLSFAQVQGTVVELAFDEGAAVAKDTVLARIDDRLYRHQIDIDQANLGIASAQVAVYESTLAAARSTLS